MILSYRLPIPRYESDEEFSRLLTFLKQHRSAVDELAFFTEIWGHAYFPLNDFAHLTETIARRIRQCRDEGFSSVGINMLVTIGHIDAAWTTLPPLPFPRIVGHDGQISKSCACPTSPAFLKYIQDKYALAAKAGPDFIWVDDDFRMANHGIWFGCFCPECLRQFHGGRYDRETLAAQLNSPAGEALRLDWVQNNVRVLETLAAHIARAVHDVNPAIEIGLMSGEDVYSGLAFDRWMKAFRGRRTRPGGGFYEDREPRLMVRKAFDIGRQCTLYPPEVNNIQFEVECCPCHKLQKSVRSILNECTLSLAAGCNGIAFNALWGLPGDLNDYQDLLNGIEREKALWSAIVEHARGLSMAGLWHAHNKHLFAKRRVLPENNWFIWYDCAYDVLANVHLAEIGLPITVDPRHACAALLSGRFPDLFTDEELRQMLSRGVMMDATAVELLWERGLGELTGVKPGRTYTDNGVFERFASHPFNGQSAGFCQVVGLALAPARELVPIAPDVQDLAHLQGGDGKDYGQCLCAFTNHLGGRIVTMSYSPWAYLGTSWKRAQMITLADWASYQQLPVIIDKPLRVTPLVRMSEDRKRFLVILLNTGFDPTGDFDLRLRAEPGEVHCLGPAGKTQMPFQCRKSEVVISIPTIDPWRVAVLAG